MEICDFRDQRQGLLIFTYVDACVLPEAETQSWFRSTFRYRDNRYHRFLMTSPGIWTDSQHTSEEEISGEMVPMPFLWGDLVLLCFESCGQHMISLCLYVLAHVLVSKRRLGKMCSTLCLQDTRGQFALLTFVPVEGCQLLKGNFCSRPAGPSS